jgi:hypothetical protein
MSRATAEQWPSLTLPDPPWRRLRGKPGSQRLGKIRFNLVRRLANSGMVGGGMGAFSAGRICGPRVAVSTIHDGTPRLPQVSEKVHEKN